MDFLANPTEAGVGEIDAIDLTLNEKEDTLYFINKKDASLWSLRLP
jgi:hypothetical protein